MQNRWNTRCEQNGDDVEKWYSFATPICSKQCKILNKNTNNNKIRFSFDSLLYI